MTMKIAFRAYPFLGLPCISDVDTLGLQIDLSFRWFSVGFVNADVGPSESECRPYIEKAIHELKTGKVLNIQLLNLKFQ